MTVAILENPHLPGMEPARQDTPPGQGNQRLYEFILDDVCNIKAIITPGPERHQRRCLKSSAN